MSSPAPPGAPTPVTGDPRDVSRYQVAMLTALAVIIIALFAWLGLSVACRRKEGLSPFRDAAGYEIPVPGDPNRNILRRSRPYPPGRFPIGGLADYYFQYDPAYSTGFETDFCWHSPIACSGFALEPFRPT